MQENEFYMRCLFYFCRASDNAKLFSRERFLLISNSYAMLSIFFLVGMQIKASRIEGILVYRRTQNVFSALFRFILIHFAGFRYPFSFFCSQKSICLRFQEQNIVLLFYPSFSCIRIIFVLLNKTDSFIHLFVSLFSFRFSKVFTQLFISMQVRSFTLE